MSRRKAGHIYKHGKSYWIKYSRNGKAYRENTRSDKESEARKLLTKRLGEIAIGRFIGPEAERITVRQLAEQYKNDYLVNAKKSLDKAERVLNQLLDFFGDYKAHQLGTDSIKAYTAKR